MQSFKLAVQITPRGFNRFILISLALLGLSVSSANAVVVGDKDWYQVSDLTSYTWNDFDAILNVTTGTCAVPNCLLGGTTDLTGYMWADNADVNTLLTHYVGATGFGSGTASHTEVFTAGSFDALFVHFTPTFADPSGSEKRLYGFSRESHLFAQRNYFGVEQGLVHNGGDLAVRLSVPGTFSSHRMGGFVYRDVSAVPVPAAVWLFGTALIGMIGFSKRKSKVAV